jgi:hypothetical protein
VCKYRNLTPEWLEANLEKIQWSALSQNPNIPAEFFEKHVKRLLEANAFEGLAENRNIPIEFFEKQTRYVDRTSILANCKLSRNYLERHLADLDWSAVSKNPSTPVEFLEDHLDKIIWTDLCYGHGTEYVDESGTQG